MPYPFTNQREMKSLSSAPWLHNRRAYGWKRSSAIATEPKRESDCPARVVDQTGNGRQGEPDRSAGRYRTRHYKEGGYKTKSHGAAFDLTTLFALGFAKPLVHRLRSPLRFLCFPAARSRITQKAKRRAQSMYQRL